MLKTTTKKKVITDHQTHKPDTGSPEVQMPPAAGETPTLPKVILTLL